jgi:hypothetical protein
MSDDEEEELDGVEDGSSERTPGKKNRCSDQVTDLKNCILLLAWNSTSSKPPTDGQGLKEMMAVQKMSRKLWQRARTTITLLVKKLLSHRQLE